MRARSARLRLAIVLLPSLMLLAHQIIVAIGPRPPYWPTSMQFIATQALVLAVAIIMYRLTVQLEREIAQRNTELVALRALMDERERLSREIHDGSAQVLAAVLAKIDTIRAHLDLGHSERAMAELDSLRQVAAETYRDTRASISGLRLGLQERGFADELQHLCTQFESRTRIPVELRIDPIVEALTPTSQLQAIRIVGEALTNIQKHAHASRVLLEVDAGSARTVRITVQDDGVGFRDGRESSASAGFGLRTMRERAESVGGWLGIMSEPGQGSAIVAELPLETRVSAARLMS